MNLILRIRGRHVDGQGLSFARAFTFAVGVGALVSASAACGVSNKPQAPETAVASPIGAGPGVTESGRDAGAPDAADALNVCGCSLCQPIVSDDACERDSDCGPASPCHATACVAASKAKPRTAGTMCTMLFACNSTDANDCGCVKNRCTLSPRAAK